MRNVWPLMVRLTSVAARSSVSPSLRRATVDAFASGNRDGSIPSPGMKGVTVGNSPTRPGIIGIPAGMGIGIAVPPGIVIPAGIAFDESACLRGAAPIPGIAGISGVGAGFFGGGCCARAPAPATHASAAATSDVRPRLTAGSRGRADATGRTAASRWATCRAARSGPRARRAPRSLQP